MEIDSPLRAGGCVDCHVALGFYSQGFKRLSLEAAGPEDVFLETGEIVGRSAGWELIAIEKGLMHVLRPGPLRPRSRSACTPRGCAQRRAGGTADVVVGVNGPERLAAPLQSIYRGG